MARLFRVPRKAALVLAVLAAVLAVPASARPAEAAHARPAAARHASSVASKATTTATISTASGGSAMFGPCSVPGINAIAGLFGFCSGGATILSPLNNICSPSLPDPEPANSGINAMVAPPASGKQPKTLYDEDGVAGDNWAATNLGCSDMTSLIGNNVAGMVFDVAKSLDRVTITVYQSAAGEGILSWLSNVTDKLISSLGHAIYFPYLAVVVIIAAIWLAWQGLIRKRATRTIEGTIWMVVACAAAIFLIGEPAEVTGLGRGVSDGISQALNVAFAKLPSPGPSNCVPVRKGDPQSGPANFAYTSGSSVVDQNANELWTVLVCQPWLDGELGTSAYASKGGQPTVVNAYGRQLLWAQVIAVNEKPTAALISAKQDTYAGIAASLQHKYPAVYPLFQGKQWTTRMEIGFAALFAAVVAGLLILLIAVTLILLKLSFLLLLVVGPFFLLIGTHPGFGRVVAMRWVEMLVGVLLKQAAVALVLSILLYCYALIMGTSGLPWALKILMIALVTVAAFIYRKPFTHLFSAVGYGVIGSRDRADADLARAGSTFRDRTVSAATVAVPGFAAYRAARWARQNPAQAAALTASAATAAGAGAGAQAATAMAANGADAESAEAYPMPEDPAAAAAAAAAEGGAPGRVGATTRARVRAASADDGTGRQAPPPLNLPSRNGAAAPARTENGAAASSAGRTAPSLPPAASGSAGAGTAGNGAAPSGGGVWPTRPATRQSASSSSASPAPAAPASSSAPPAPAAAPSRSPAAPASRDRKSTRLNSSHERRSRMPSSA